MLRRYVAISLLLAAGSSSIAREVSQDSIKGALVGAALGDALGRITTPLDTLNEIDSVYGNKGIGSLDQYADEDWGKDKVAPYSSNTVLSLLTLELIM